MFVLAARRDKNSATCYVSGVSNGDVRDCDLDRSFIKRIKKRISGSTSGDSAMFAVCALYLSVDKLFNASQNGLRCEAEFFVKHFEWC